MTNDEDLKYFQERICKILSKAKGGRFRLKNIGLKDSLTLDYFIEELPEEEFTDNIKETLLKDLFFTKTNSVSKNVIDDLIEILSTNSYVNRNLKVDELNISIDPQLLIAGNNYLSFLTNDIIVKTVIKATKTGHLKTLIFIDEIYSRLDDKYVDSLIEKSKNTEYCAILVSRYCKELSRFTQSSSEMKKKYKKTKRIAKNSDFSLDNIKYMKEAKQSLAECLMDYKTITKNPELAKQVDDIRKRYSEIKKDTEGWLFVRLKKYFETEVKNIKFDTSSAKTLEEAVRTLDNASSEFNQINKRYEASGLSSGVIGNKVSQFSAVAREIDNHKKTKAELANNIRTIGEYRRWIKNSRLNNISYNLAEIINTEKGMRQKIGKYNCRFQDIKDYADRYIEESDGFNNEVSQRVALIRDYIGKRHDTLEKKAGTYEKRDLPGIFKRSRKSLRFLQRGAMQLNNYALQVKKEFGLPDYMMQKISTLNRKMDSLVRSYNQPFGFRKKFAYAAAGMIFLISAGVYTGIRPEANINHSRMQAVYSTKPESGLDNIVRNDTAIIRTDNRNKADDKSQYSNTAKNDDIDIKRYVESMKQKYESRFNNLKDMFARVDTQNKYESAQKQLGLLKAEIKGFMSSEIYKQYKRDNND